MSVSRVSLAVLFAGCTDPTTSKDTSTAPVDGTIETDTDTDADSDTDTDTDTDLGCEASIVSVDPADGAIDVLTDAVVTVTFDAPITDADPLSIDVSGGAGVTELAADGLSATWTGDVVFGYETTYVVQVDVCEDSNTSAFTTVPEPLDLTTLEGNTYLLEWADLNIQEPPNGALLQTLIAVEFVMAQILTVDVTTSTADAIATVDMTDDGLAVPECDLAVYQTADLSNNPFLEISGTLTIDVGQSSADIEDFLLVAQMGADGLAINDVELSGLVATESFVAGEDCVNGSLIQLLNPTCVACTSSATGMCMLLEARAATAPLDPKLDVAGFCGL